MTDRERIMPGDWADQATPAVKQDLTMLLNATLDVVVSGLQRPSPPSCFLVLMDLEGRLTVRLGYGHTDVTHLVTTVFDQEAALRAVLCVRNPGTEADPELVAFGEHREAPAFHWVLHWQRIDGLPRLRVTDSTITFSQWWFFA